jgi:hypothetical protein
MIRWSGDRKCIIDRDGKEEEFNVNRLTKQYQWDAEHPDTSGVMDERKASRARAPIKAPATIKLHFPAEVKQSAKPSVGQVIIFHKPLAIGHRSPFGVGVVLELRPNDTYHYRWLGNRYYNANGMFLEGWINLQEEMGYYGRKNSRVDVAWTGDHTGEPVTLEMLIAWGDDLLNAERRLTAKAHKLITLQVGKQESWKQFDYWTTGT